MFKEFKEFAMRGSVIDMAIGIIIGGAFGPIVGSMVNDILMPPIGLALGNVDFTNLFILIKEGSRVAAPYSSLADARAAGAVTINYGLFINSVVSFIIVAFCVFLLVKTMNRLKREEAVPPPEPNRKDCPFCFSAIPINASRCPHCTSAL